MLLDRLVRQGRAFGIHVLLGSQTIGGSSGLARSTLGQMAVRIALQMHRGRFAADPRRQQLRRPPALPPRRSDLQRCRRTGRSQQPLPDRLAARRAARRLPRARPRTRQGQDHVIAPTPIVFEGNSPADIRKNRRLMALLQRASLSRRPPPPSRPTSANRSPSRNPPPSPSAARAAPTCSWSASRKNPPWPSFASIDRLARRPA